MNNIQKSCHFLQLYGNYKAIFAQYTNILEPKKCFSYTFPNLQTKTFYGIHTKSEFNWEHKYLILYFQRQYNTLNRNTVLYIDISAPAHANRHHALFFFFKHISDILSLLSYLS